MIAVIFEFTPAQGRAGIFQGCRLRIVSVLRDSEMDKRWQAPQDSVAVHG
jgi:hypothetical protein